jgi:hypothetical protein
MLQTYVSIVSYVAAGAVSVQPSTPWSKRMRAWRAPERASNQRMQNQTPLHHQTWSPWWTMQPINTWVCVFCSLPSFSHLSLAWSSLSHWGTCAVLSISLGFARCAPSLLHADRRTHAYALSGRRSSQRRRGAQHVGRHSGMHGRSDVRVLPDIRALCMSCFPPKVSSTD